MYVTTICYESPLLFLFMWLNRTIIMAPYLAGLYSNLMLLLVCVLNSLVFNFRRRSVWTGKLLLMCKLCTVFHSALFIFIIHLMLHFLAESKGFWKSTFLVPRVSFKTEWFFSNLILRVHLFSVRFGACWPRWICIANNKSKVKNQKTEIISFPSESQKVRNWFRDDVEGKRSTIKSVPFTYNKRLISGTLDCFMSDIK